MSKLMRTNLDLDSMNQTELMKLLRVKEMENERLKKGVASLMAGGEFLVLLGGWDGELRVGSNCWGDN